MWRRALVPPALALMSWTTPPGASPAPAPEVAATLAPALPPGTGLAHPALALGLAPVGDDTTAQPFLDLMKTARPWTGRRRRGHQDIPTRALAAAGYLGPHGWPVALPPEADRLLTQVLTDQPAAAKALAGTYVLRYRGAGVIRLGGRADNKRYDYARRRILFDYTPGPGAVTLKLLRTDPSDPIRDITITRADRAQMREAGAVFNPDWLARIADMRALRLADWMRVNDSDRAHWDERPQPGDFSYAWRGVPAAVLVRLANLVGVDPWVTLPHRADDDYVRQFARYMRDHLDPRLHVYAEWSNEVWNGAYPQAAWAAQQARARWGDRAGQDGAMQFAGMRAAQVADIWAAVFTGPARARLVTVLGGATRWPGLEQAALDAPLWQAEAPGKIAPPVTRFDAYAVSGYFGTSLGQPDMAARLRDWIAASRTLARQRGQTGAASDDTLALRFAAQHIRTHDLHDLNSRLWPYHAGVAARRGLRLLMYEGGADLAARGQAADDPAITGFLSTLASSPQMGALYDQAITGWRQAGGGMFNAYAEMAAPRPWANWGTLRFPGDDTPRWRALMRANATPPPVLPARAPDTFLQGVIRQAATADGTTLSGTARRDILLGGGGSDTLISGGGDDLLHGGNGRDLAILPGRAGEWQARMDGGHWVVTGPKGRVTLTAIEDVGFASEGAQMIRRPVASLRRD